MKKTMADLYKEIGPQGWYDDPITEEDNSERIEALEDRLYEIDDRLEDIGIQKDGLDAEEEELLTKASIIEEELKKLRGRV